MAGPRHPRQGATVNPQSLGSGELLEAYRAALLGGDHRLADVLEQEIFRRMCW